VGFATANNQAIAASSGRYVLLLNSDTVVHPGAFDVLVRFMDEHPEAGAAGPLTLNPNGTLQLSCYPSPTLARELWFLLHLDRLHPYGVYPMARWNRGQPRPVDAVLGACLMVRRSVLEQVGVLDPAYFMYSEEIDLCYRIQRAGWRIYWAPAAVIDHYGGQSTRQVAASMFLQLYRSKVRFFRKNQGRWAAVGYKLVLLAVALPRGWR
jgi:GT2 family glycosyltransferase